MENGERDEASDGSDIELDSDESNAGNGEQMFEVHDIRVYDEENDIVRQIFDSESEDDQPFDGFQNGWQTNNFVRRFPRHYRRQQGINVPVPDNPKALDFFSLFWDERFFRRLVDETNRYAAQQRALHPPAPTSRWRDVTDAEMKTFISLCIMMGIIRLPCRSDYWRTKESCWLAHTNFGKAISRDRFNAIWRYLHLHDSSIPADGDKLVKVRWLLNHLTHKYQTVYTPGPTYTVDETMVKFKGRLGIRQYLPMKPTKWGIKVWCLCESTTGYTSNLQVYTGRDGQRAEHGLAHRVVMDMCVPLQGSNAQVYFDNFFTSCRLLEDMKTLNLQGCGTVRANRRGLPQELVPKKGRPALDKHQYRVAQQDDLVFVHWQDTKPVLVLSNFHDPEQLGQVRRNERAPAPAQQQPRGGNRRLIPVPGCLSDYQRHMKGVDLADQMTNYYLLNHRSWKWWRRLFFQQMMVSIYNAYIVAKQWDPQRARQQWDIFQDFVEDVAHQMVTTTISRNAPAAEAPALATLNHNIDRIFQTRRVCTECSRRAPPNERRRTTKFGCVQCQVPCHPECLANHLRHNAVVANNRP